MSDQKNWDAALIKTWRTGALLIDTIKLFCTLSNKRIEDCDPPLRRFPPKGVPWKHMTTRYFTAHWLPKINDALWNQDPSKDINLLRKLENATYDTLKHHIQDKDAKRNFDAIKRSESTIKLNQHFKSTRNHDTDWSVTKGSRRHSR